MNEYIKFLQQKKNLESNHGFKPSYIPDYLFDYQQYIVDYVVRKGRFGTFADTGLGKTAMELVIAKNIVEYTNKPVLILTPLAVAFQFIEEAEKFGIDDIQYSKDGKYKSKIVITNYERLSHFNPSDFEGVLLDESALIKNVDGATRKIINAFLRKVKYRHLFTATPSPNDFIELGSSSEVLGYMGYMDMLTKFFKNNEDTISPQNIGTQWILKGHAREAFFEWVSSWSLSIRKPSDLGFSDEKHILPPLNINDIVIHNDENLTVNGQTMLFAVPATRLTEVREEQKLTISQRCEKAVESTNGYDSTVYWTNLNNESDLLEQLDKDAVQLKGGMSLDQKEDILLNFAHGNIKNLITKPKITAFGLNWQHCNHTVYFPTFSYEQYYQAIRRFWRFGQKRPVYVDRIYSEGQTKVLQSLIAKAEKADELFSKLNYFLHSKFEDNVSKFDNKVKLPEFIRR